jgi:hypothetical protein
MPFIFYCLRLGYKDNHWLSTWMDNQDFNPSFATDLFLFATCAEVPAVNKPGTACLYVVPELLDPGTGSYFLSSAALCIAF